MVILAALAGAGASGLYSYNQANFFFDKDVQQKRDYQGQEMRIRQFELYREDVRDLIQLTVRKMDNYLLVNTLQLGFCLTLFCDGRPERISRKDWFAPPWLVGLYAICNSGAFVYYLLSIWLAMHASIAAHSFGVRLLNQCVRLPVPSDAQLDEATAQATDYESSRVGDILRVPLWKIQLAKMNQVMSNSVEDESEGLPDPADDPGMQSIALLRHVQLFRKLQANWQSYDAYARVCMAMGTNQLLHAVSYEILMLLMAESRKKCSTICCVVLFTACAWVLAKLDVCLSRKSLCIMAFLLVAPPLVATICLCLLEELRRNGQGPSNVRKMVHDILVPLVYSLHFAWFCFIVRIAKAEEVDNKVKLPTKFRSVLYLDVFGWLQEEPSEVAKGRPDVQEELPQTLRELLISDCWRLQRRIRADLIRWESEDVELSLKEDSGTCQNLRAMRSRFARFSNEWECASANLPVGSDDDGMDQDCDGGAVWLQIEWVARGRSQSYWYCHESGTSLWEVPTGGVRICTASSLNEDIDTFGEQVATIDAKASRPQQQASASASINSSSPSAHTSGEAIAQPEPNSAGTSSSAAPANLQRQNRRRVAATPGRLPWDTVRKASYALLCIWFTAVPWAIISCLGIKFPFDHNKPHLSVTVRDLPTIVEMPIFGGRVGVPLDLLNPVGIACHDSIDGVAIVAGKYTVKAVSLGYDGDSEGASLQRAIAIEAALSACLLSEPVFLSLGIADITISCRKQASKVSCDAVLLGFNGTEALRCFIPVDAHVGSGPPSTLLQLRGGPWAALSDSHYGFGAWALGRGRMSVVELRRRTGKAGSLRPIREVATGDVESSCETDYDECGLPFFPLVHFDAARDKLMLLVRSAAAAIRSIPLDGGRLVDWMLPDWNFHEWRGLCTASDSTFLVASRRTPPSDGSGTVSTFGGFSIWKADWIL